MKILRFLSEHILFIFTLFLLAFIPLYPKIPVIGVQHTWVYIRLEDFFVALAVIIFLIQVLRKKAYIRTYLTVPIVAFWVIGAVSTIYAVIVLFPHLANVFPSIAALNYLRRIEYISLFFIAFSSIKNKKFVPYVVGTLTLTLLAVVFYGVGQRLWQFPAFETMNEEFAKGIPLILSSGDRIPSTFAGHYDLAAYLVLVIPIIVSMIFGFKNIFAKVFLFLTWVSGVVLLLMTASRVSFVVYLAGVVFMLILQKQKKWIIPAVVGSLLLLNLFQGTAQRFGNTITQVDTVYDARTGKAIGVAKSVGTGTKKKVVINEVQSTGENLPTGSAYISVPQQVAQQTITQVVYQKSQLKAGKQTTEVTNVQGDFVIKKAFALDVSFTTRFQGEWPRAIEAFQRNFLVGSGYSSISLATDNNYLRILGESGLLGMIGFVGIFLVFGIYVWKLLPDVDSKSAKSFVVGVVGGIFGLALNATLIDVFEASKDAFVLWTLIGVSMGILFLYHKKQIAILQEIKRVILSIPMLLLYLLSSGVFVFWQGFDNYFVADDFTWLRWVADCKKVLYSNGSMNCEPVKTTVIRYFTDSTGFFYRPGTKLYFFVMYSLFWINSTLYHVSSYLIHFLVTGLVLILSLRLFKNRFFAFLVAFIFLIASVHSEEVFWVSATGHLIASFCILLALFLHILSKTNKKYLKILFILGTCISMFVSTLFYELGVVAPILVIVYDFVSEADKKRLLKRIKYIFYLLVIPLYYVIRTRAHSLWFNGDYSYNLPHLPANVFGNLIGYFMVSLGGNALLPWYESLRNFSKNQVILSAILGIVIGVFLIGCIILVIRECSDSTKKILYISLVLFVVPLLPFLGLGNITFRYVYLASFGVYIFLVLLLKKGYERIARSNRPVAAIVLLLFILLFTYFQITGLWGAEKDWQKAGTITRNVLLDFNSTFDSKNPVPQNPVFYFTNVPIKTGQAWIFPVGLDDALWFTFQNQNLTVHTEKTLDDALHAAEGSSSARIFEFDKNANVLQITKTVKTFTLPTQ